MSRIFVEDDVEALTIGGTILGDGAGGLARDRSKGRFVALQIGIVELWGPDEADPDWKVITSAALGARP